MYCKIFFQSPLKFMYKYQSIIYYITFIKPKQNFIIFKQLIKVAKKIIFDAFKTINLTNIQLRTNKITRID